MPQRGTQSHKARVGSLAIFVALCGCVPVSTVVAHTAAVVPRGQAVKSVGGAVFLSRIKEHDQDEYSDALRGYVHVDWLRGMGGRTDAQFGVTGLRVFAVLRHQLYGTPYGMASNEAESGCNLSVEAGGSFFPLRWEVAPSDVHLGASLSFPLGGNATYVTYRRHWGHQLQAYSTPFRYDEIVPFNQHAFFLGLEMPIDNKRWHSIIIEVFYTRPTVLEADGSEDKWQSGGVNVIFRRF